APGQLIVKRAPESLAGLSREKGTGPGLQRELAAAYEKVGDVLGKAGSANLGDTAGAQASYKKALEIRERLAAGDPENRALLLELAAGYDSGSELTNPPQYPDAAARPAPHHTAAKKALEISYHRVASSHSDHKEFDKALAYRQKQVEVAEAVRKAAPNDPTAPRDLAIAYKYVGGCYEGLRRPLDGLEYYRRA